MLKCAILFLVILIQNTLPSYGMDENPRRGIDHIDPEAHKYSYWVGNYSGYGYTIEKNTTIDGTLFQPYGAYKWCPANFTSQCTRSLTTDMREALLDHDRFMLALDESRFGDAWRMGLANEQGEIWKRRAIIKAKSKIKKLAKKYVSENEHLPTLTRATDIVQQFNGLPPLPPYQELFDLLQTTLDAERTRLAEKDKQPSAQEAELAILRRIGQRLFEK